MSLKFFAKSGAISLLIICCIVQGLTYPGSQLNFALFSATFLILVTSLIFKWNGYFYTFSAALLFLGFWLKFFWHSVSGLAYVEPTGFFGFTAREWDEVLFVASLGTLAMVVTNAILRFFIADNTEPNTKLFRSEFVRDNWRRILFFFLASIILLLAVNLHYSLVVIGVRPQTTLIFPFNAFVTLMLMGGGVALTASILSWVLIVNKVHLYLVLMIVIGVGILLNISCLSRGLSLALTLPLFYAAYINRKLLHNLTRYQVATIAISFLLSLVLSFFTVNTLRDKYYYVDKVPQKEIILRDRLDAFLHFSIDRWTGLEGLMAVVAYEKKSIDLFKQAVLDRPYNKPSIYETVCPWPDALKLSLKKEVRNFSMPGLFAFLYYSNSALIVAVLVSLITTIGLLVEAFVFRVIKDPFFTATLSWLVATNTIMFSGVPMFHLPLVEFYALFILMYWLLIKFSVRYSPKNIILMRSIS